MLLSTLLNDHITRLVATSHRADPQLDIGDCESLAVYSFLWNVASVLGRV